MKFTLVTTCYNEIDSVNNWKNDVSRQTRQPDEIVIVDACSTDGTLEVLKEWAKTDRRVKLIEKKSKPAAGRNLAIENAENQYIVSTDMGCRLDEKWFEKLSEPFEKNSEIDVAAGNYKVLENSLMSPAAWADYYINDRYNIVLENNFLPSNRSVAYKKSVWIELGKYPEDLTFAGDDAVFGLQLYKAGYRFFYAKDAVCYWNRHTALKDFWKEQFRYGLANGEANILPQRFCKYYKSKLYMPAVYFHAVKRALLNSSSAIKMAVKDNRMMPALYIPFLVYGNYRNYYYGYRKGLFNGEVKCQDCRKRLEPNGEKTKVFQLSEPVEKQ